MRVYELIEKLSTMKPDSQVLVQYMNANAYGSCWKDLADFDEDDVRTKSLLVLDDIVIIDITDK